MAVTLTVGGATCGYWAIGICGMASTPARMITSEQTVARIGRRMNVSTNKRRQPSGFGFNRNTVLQLLDIGDDHFLAFLHTASDDVGVADENADGNRLLPR